MAYDMLSRVLKKSAHTTWKSWETQFKDKYKRTPNWRQFVKCFSGIYANEDVRHLHLETAITLSMERDRLTVKQFFERFEEAVRPSGQKMPDKTRAFWLRQGLAPEIRQPLAHVPYKTVLELQRAATAQE